MIELILQINWMLVLIFTYTRLWFARLWYYSPVYGLVWWYVTYHGLLYARVKLIRNMASQLTHNVFITLLESCAELFWDKRCSNLVATFDQIYFVWQWKWVISNVATTLQQRYLATYNVAATLFGNICPTFAQSCHSTLWQRSRNFPG